jgi:pimeloyl-ACP methyl ester carboxylesterase
VRFQEQIICLNTLSLRCVLSWRPVLLLLVFIAAGCQSLRHCDPAPSVKRKGPPDPNLLSYHVIQVNADGFLLDLRPGAKAQPITDPPQVEAYLQGSLFKGFRESGKSKVLLFVHGGMNAQKQGMQHFWSDYEHIRDASDYYPVFVVWPSGFASTYFEHLLWVRQGIRAETASEKAFSLATSPFRLLADLGRALTRLPLVVANNTRTDLETVTAIRHTDGGAAVHQYQDLVKEGYYIAVDDDYSKHSDRALRAVTYWVTLPIKYFGASLIDGFGQGAWNDMLRRTQEVYPSRMADQELQRVKGDVAKQANLTMQQASAPAQNTPSTRNLSKRQEKRGQRFLAAGLPTFMKSLRQMQSNAPDLEVTLVGHSMGAIILNRVVRDSEIHFTNIIYLAAACSIEDFRRSVLPYMATHHGTEFYNLSLHPVAEAGELNNSLFDFPPRGSLLAWIDNFLANPVSEQERTLGAWENLFRVSPTGEPIMRSFFDDHRAPKLKERLHFKAFAVGFGNEEQLRPEAYQWNDHCIPKDIQERCDNPLIHGEFSEMPYWKPAFWWKPYSAIVPGH